jgi:peptide deformylase
MSVDPAKLRIEIYPTEVLRAKAPEIGVTPEVRAVAERMVTLMAGAEGIGLAAPQVGLSWRLFVAHVPAHEGDPNDPEFPCNTAQPQAFVNPVIVETSDDLEPYDEGCLSLPGITGEVRRPSKVTMKALDLDGKEIEINASGLLARCWQHEIDHLDGVLILDKMSQTSRLKNRTRIKAMEKAKKR